MIMKRSMLLMTGLALLLALLACRKSVDQPGAQPATNAPTPVAAKPTAAPALPAPVKPGAANPDEPVFIYGEIPYTSPFFLNSTSEPFVMLEDEAGFVKRDQEFEFSLREQAIGPVSIDANQKLTYSLALPAVPQATQLDLDNNGKTDLGVQVFAVAYWSNTWGDPFLEPRDGKGWSNAYASTLTDPENDYEITGGTLVVWSPDDKQGFPTDFGPDGKLFTQDDPTAPIPAGYNLVDLSQKPFRVYKEAQPEITLNEGVVAVNDYSSLSYAEAFQKLFDKASQEYPFTEQKRIDWPALRQTFMPRAQQAVTPEDFFRLLRDFAQSIPDGHVGVSFNQQVFFDQYGGGYGLVLAELSDGKVIAAQVLPNTPAAQAGIQPGAEMIQWNGKPVGQAIAAVTSGFGPYSSPHARRAGQVTFLQRGPVNAPAEVIYQNPGGSQASVSMQAAPEYNSLFKTLPSFNEDPLGLPVQAEILKDSGLGYIRINTFNDDYNLMARLWDRAIKNAIDNKVPGLILDLRSNSGGSLGLAMNFAGYFFDQTVPLYQSEYYNARSGQFKPTRVDTRIEPGPDYFDGPVAVLVSADCVSACEGFSYAMQQNGRAIVIGHTPSAGAFGEVGLGQYKLPDDLSMQFPTGRSKTAAGQIVLEGQGVTPDILVPVTADSALGKVDAVLQQAIQTLLEKIR